MLNEIIFKAKHDANKIRWASEYLLTAHDIKKIAMVKNILHHQPTMTGDDMRDLAQILELVIEHCEIITELE
jgi:hypothetical protein